jgi:hypothetical protein
VCFRTHRWRRRLAKTWALLYSGMDVMYNVGSGSASGRAWYVDALINRESVTSSMWDVHGCAKAAKVGLRLKGETRVRGKRGIGTQSLEQFLEQQ